MVCDTKKASLYLMGNSKPVTQLLQRLTNQTQTPNIIYFGDSVVSDLAFNTWEACYVETDVDYPEWVEKITPEKHTRLCDYVSLKYCKYRVRTLDDLVNDDMPDM